MEPRIQYAKTADGVSIAYTVMGDGPPLIRLPVPGAAHVQRDWSMFSDLLSPVRVVTGAKPTSEVRHASVFRADRLESLAEHQ